MSDDPPYDLRVLWDDGVAEGGDTSSSHCSGNPIIAWQNAGLRTTGSEVGFPAFEVAPEGREEVSHVRIASVSDVPGFILFFLSASVVALPLDA
jgi:hypothetical protein